MKIALLGNMNNSNFCVMRYLRDLGLDAYLLLYTNELEHFTPPCDTYQMEKWSKYIVQTDLANGDLLNYVFTSRKKIRKVLSGYDFYIGHGSAPAWFYKAKMKLDIFIPYSVGVEWIFQDSLKLNWTNSKALKRSLFNLIRTALKLTWQNPYKICRGFSLMLYKNFQVKGLKNNTRQAISMDVASIDTLTALGVPVKHYGVPGLYKLEEYRVEDQALQPYIDRMKRSPMVLYSHVAHNYKNVVPLFDIKKNYLLIEGFADFVKRTGNTGALLVLHSYGDDVNESKRLIDRLNITEQVLWIPLILRKSLINLLSFAHIGGGEFGGVIWGSTGWEFLATGVPFFQSVDLTEKEFESIYKMPMPPIINVDTPSAISKHLEDCFNNPETYRKRGEEGKQWYEQYSGISLALAYKKLILEIYAERRKAHHLPDKVISYASQLVLPICMSML